MEASIIIPTYQGRDRIMNIVKALENQSLRNFELIIVIDGSTDGTIEILHSSVLPIREVKIVEQNNKGRAGARNAGINLAQSNIIIFYDDDMIPERNSVEKHVLFHRHNMKSILVGNAPQTFDKDKNDFYQYREYIANGWVDQYPDAPVQLTPNNFFMTAANCSIPVDVLRQLSGFNEVLTDAEDQELGIRALKADIPLFFDKTNIAWHNEYVSCRSYIKRLRQYAIANIVVSRLHPDTLNAKANLILPPLRKLIYYLLAKHWLVILIDGFNIFLILPRKVRYKLYDAVTFALSRIHLNVPL